MLSIIISAGVVQLVERFLAKEKVAGPSPVTRSNLRLRRLSSVALCVGRQKIQHLLLRRRLLRLARPSLKRSDMYYVYILRSIKYPRKLYKGYSTNLKKRLIDHNSGFCKYTSWYRPWKIIFYAVFIDKYTALRFEKYLKSGSGKSFTRKRLIN